MLRRRTASAAAVVVVAIALATCVPPWLAARYVSRAYAGDTSWERDLDRARTLDPLSVAPLVARATLAPDTGEAVRALHEALKRQPDSVELYYLLGRRYLAVGNRRAALAPLREARRLAPRDSFVLQALRRAERGG